MNDSARNALEAVGLDFDKIAASFQQRKTAYIRPKKKAICGHPEHYAHGLCRKCWSAKYFQEKGKFLR